MGNLKLRWSLSSLLLGIIVISLGKFIYREAKLETLAIEAELTSTSSAHRSPASIRKTFDFSGLAGVDLQKAAKKRLLESLSVENDADNSIIRLGNFVLLNDQKEKDFACGFFDRVTLNFEAQGVAVDGEKPVLTVEAPCNIGARNINELEPIKIPFKKIQELKPGEQDLQFSNDYLSDPDIKVRGPSSGFSLRIQMNHPPAEWPTSWVLVNVEMTHTQAAYRNLHISQDEIRELANKPVLMNW